MSTMKPNYCNDITIEQMLSLKDSFSIILATHRNRHLVKLFHSKPKIKMRKNYLENFLFVFLLKKATFLSRAVELQSMYPLSYITDTLQNYIPLSYPHYIHHTKYTLKVDKPLFYVMIGSEEDMIIHTRTDMMIHKCINT